MMKNQDRKNGLRFCAAALATLGFESKSLGFLIIGDCGGLLTNTTYIGGNAIGTKTRNSSSPSGKVAQENQVRTSYLHFTRNNVEFESITVQ